MRVPWTAKRSNQSILKEISPEYSLEGLMLKLKCQYVGHLMQRTNSLEKTLMLGRIDANAETEAEAEAPILGHLMQRADSLEKTLMLGGIGGRRRRG